MDVWVNFTHATKWQAEGIFKCFFPFKPSSTASDTTATSTAAADELKDTSQQNLPLPKRKAFAHATPILTEEEITELAKRFAEAIPEDELSVSIYFFQKKGVYLFNLFFIYIQVAGLQGYLLKNKTRPRECVDEVGEWIIQERETREKLRKEKLEV